VAKKASKKAKARKSTSRSPKRKGSTRGAQPASRRQVAARGGTKPASKGINLKELQAHLRVAREHVRGGRIRDLGMVPGDKDPETTLSALIDGIQAFCDDGGCGGGMIVPPPPPPPEA